jgi:SAM-dependent methyltransferase
MTRLDAMEVSSPGCALRTAESRNAGWLAAAALLAALSAPAGAGEQHPFADAPYVPTPAAVVEAMLELAGVGPADYVIDLGSGDGRIVIAAAKRRGARGLGVEIDGALVQEARREARRQGVAGRVEFRSQDMLVTDIGRATVVTMYLFSGLMERLRPRLIASLRPGSRVVSHEFDMGGWEPDARVTVPVADKPYGAPFSDVLMWIVPADAGGVWRWRSTIGAGTVDFEAALLQEFQKLRGAAVAGGRAARMEAALRGDEIRLSIDPEEGAGRARHEFRGRVSGDVIRGIVRPAGGGEAAWEARRVRRK